MEVQERASPAEQRETRQLVLPTAWIGSREDFDTEQRYGDWLDVSREPRAVMTDIRAIIDRTPDGLGQQWQVCATRGLGGWTPTEYEGLPELLNIATGVVAFGEHYGGLASAIGANSPALSYERYQQSFLGSWTSPRAFVEDVVKDSGWREAFGRLPANMRRYVVVDYQALLDDVRKELTVVDHPEGVWVYDPRVW